MDAERVDAVLVDALRVLVLVPGRFVAWFGNAHVRRTEDCAVPVGHEKVIALVQTVRACLFAIVSESVWQG